jgi:hypothetical protein
LTTGEWETALTASLDAEDGARFSEAITLKNRRLLSVARCEQRSTIDLEVTYLCAVAQEADRLPRKEVIQPHLPVRLPCYDFTPITDPTLDACLQGEPWLAQRLQVLPAFVV